MRIFVLSCFFPPENSSEGLVTYKLLSSSQHEYFVCSARSNRWGYEKEFGFSIAPNITLSSIKTDEILKWVDFCVATFMKEHEKKPFDAIMTRTMPPESILGAKKIKKKFPNLIWIASLGDPISKNPYTLHGLYGSSFSIEDFNTLIRAIDFPNELNSKNSFITPYLREMKDLESFAIECSDAWIVPCEELANYMAPKQRQNNLLVVPHSFKKEFYPAVSKYQSNSKLRLVYIGHLDQLRNLDSLVEAVKELKAEDPLLNQKLEILIYGNGLNSLSNKVFNFYLYDIFKIEGDVSYLDSLKIMNEADWLIHVDASFNFLNDKSGSIFFAGKLADYMGTQAKIFAITSKGSTAEKIVENCGGICSYPEENKSITNGLKELISIGKKTINEKERKFRDNFESRAVASFFDESASRLLAFKSQNVDQKQKILSICIPSYNSERYLERALTSINQSKYLNFLEVLIVNDGSTDNTELIGKEWCNKNSSVFYLINKKNGGHGSTINSAIPLATGLYFRVLDSDDWIETKELDSLIEKILNKKFNGIIYPDLISSNYSQIINENGIDIKFSKVNQQLLYDRVYYMENTSFNTEYFSIHSLFYKTKILKDHLAELRLQEHTFYVDVEYMFFPLLYVNSFMLCKESIYRYSVGRGDQSVNLKNFLKRKDHHDRVMRNIAAWICKNESLLSPSKSDYIARLCFLHFETHVKLLTSSKNIESYRKLKDFHNFLKSHPSVIISRATSKIPVLSIDGLALNNYLFYLITLSALSSKRKFSLKVVEFKGKAKSKLKDTKLYIPLRNLKRIFDQIFKQ